MKWAFQICAVILMCSLVASAAQERKKRVAVLEFEYATVRTEVSSVFGTEVDIGKGIADLLVKHLVKDGSYAVIERKALETVLAEQNFSTSRRGDPASAARIGKMLGVDAIILGSITQFGGEREQKSTVGAGGTVGGVVRKNDQTNATVTLDARIVDVDSGEILAVADGTGESSRSGKSAGGLILGKGFFGFGGVDFSSSKFQETIIGEAVKRAVEQMSVGVIAASPTLAARAINVEGLVAFADGSTVVLNVGRKTGLKLGIKLSVERVTQEIRDPVSGGIIRRLTSPIGEIEVTETDDSSAVCKILRGDGIKVGDLARTAIQ
jgi:curli biogenesis system outer membrane secretion channel CsgG